MRSGTQEPEASRQRGEGNDERRRLIAYPRRRDYGQGPGTPPLLAAPRSTQLASWYDSSYTRFVKTAISIPDPLFHAAERAAKRQKVSRSRFYAKAVTAYVKSQREKGIKEALDAVYASEPSQRGPALAAAAYHVLSNE